MTPNGPPPATGTDDIELRLAAVLQDMEPNGDGSENPTGALADAVRFVRLHRFVADPSVSAGEGCLILHWRREEVAAMFSGDGSASVAWAPNYTRTLVDVPLEDPLPEPATRILRN